MDKQIGFIGCGKMAQAMIVGLLRSPDILPSQIIASAASNQTLSEVKEAFQIHTTLANREVARQSDYLFLAVKPDIYDQVLMEIKDILNEKTVIITIAAGITLRYMEDKLGTASKIIRSMPNTPSLVGEGMSVLCANQAVTMDELKDVIGLFECFGEAEMVEEKLMDSIPAVSGSSPAYVYMFIEAMADGAVKQGIPRIQAYKLAAQAVLGAAKMVLETDMHPGELKDNVCTPGGATIEAVTTLEKYNFRSSVIAAMESCTTKSKELGMK